MPRGIETGGRLPVERIGQGNRPATGLQVPLMQVFDRLEMELDLRLAHGGRMAEPVEPDIPANPGHIGLLGTP